MDRCACEFAARVLPPARFALRLAIGVVVAELSAFCDAALAMISVAFPAVALASGSIAFPAVLLRRLLLTLVPRAFKAFDLGVPPLLARLPLDPLDPRFP